jgi:hypothetical protein
MSHPGRRVPAAPRRVTGWTRYDGRWVPGWASGPLSNRACGSPPGDGSPGGGARPQPDKGSAGQVSCGRSGRGRRPVPLANIKAVPAQVRSLGSIDVVIHNAGIYESGGRGETVDGLERTFQVNVLAPVRPHCFIPLRGLRPRTGVAACAGSARLRKMAANRRRVSTTGVSGRSGVRSIWLSQCRCRVRSPPGCDRIHASQPRQFYREDRRVPGHRAS